MESLTKTAINAETIINIVKHEFNTAVSTQDIIPLTDGWFNNAYTIHLPNEHPDVVLRIAPPPTVRVLTYEKELMRREVTLHHQLQTTTNLPLPKLLAHNFSHEIIPQDYMFVTKLKGIPLDKIHDQLTNEEQQQIVIQLGQLTANINQIEGEQFGYADTLLSANNWADAYLKMVLTLLDDGENLGAKLPVPIADVRALYRDAKNYFPDLKRPSLCHFDLWMPNIFVVKQNGRYQIEAITDWERAFWGDPQADTIIANNPFGAPFWTGYGRKPNDHPDTQTRLALYRIYLWLIMLIEAKVRFKNAPHLPWTREQFNKDWQFLTKM